MKQLLQNRSLCIAVAVSVLLHMVVLSVHFGISPVSSPDKMQVPIELVLVNSPQRRMIDMAAVNQTTDTPWQGQIGKKSGHGSAAGGTKSGKVPGAPAGKTVETAPPATAKTGKNTGKNVGETAGKKIMSTAPSGSGDFSMPEDQDSRSVVFRRNARGGSGSGGSNGGAGGGRYGMQGRPVITASTRDVGYAMYYKALRKRVENFGLINFPQRNGTRLYGELTVRIPVYRDGTLFEKEGGPGIERSSGNPALDRAALNIIRRAAPFGPFPKSMQAKNGGADVWIIITKLRFTRDQGVQSQIRVRQFDSN